MKLLGSKNKKNLFYFVLRSVCTIFVPAETELDVRLSDHLPVRGDRVAYPDVPSSPSANKHQLLLYSTRNTLTNNLYLSFSRVRTVCVASGVFSRRRAVCVPTQTAFHPSSPPARCHYYLLKNIILQTNTDE